MWMPFSCFQQSSQQNTRAQICCFNSDQTFATLPRAPSAPRLGMVSFPCLLAMFPRSCYFRTAVCTKLALENIYSSVLPAASLVSVQLLQNGWVHVSLGAQLGFLSSSCHSDEMKLLLGSFSCLIRIGLIAAVSCEGFLSVNYWMLFQRFGGAGFKNNQFSCFSSVVVRSSFPVSICAFSIPCPCCVAHPDFPQLSRLQLCSVLQHSPTVGLQGWGMWGRAVGL